MNIDKEQFWAVVFIFESANGKTLDDYEKKIVAASGLSDRLADELAQSLVQILEQESPEDSNYRGQAYWALGKRFDPKLLPRFRKWLAYELEQQQYGALYQIMIALDNLEEPVFSSDRDGSYSVDDTGQNRQDAQHYLEQQGR